MFREFNVKFENVEMLEGSDNLLEGSKVTKVIMRGDNKMSSLDSAFKNCSELDTIDGELDLNNVGDIDSILENTELLKRLNVKNVNNENMSVNNAFPNIDELTIGGELYNKKAMQNLIASRDWTFNNINYVDTVGDNVVTKETNINDDNKVTIQDTLEQKARGFEVVGQTYENLIVGNGEVTLLDELTLESVDGSTKEFNPHIEQPVCVEVVEGNTVQDESNIYSIGELQEDGTYKIDILSNDGFFYVYNNGKKDSDFIFEGGSREQDNILILAHSHVGKIKTDKKYTINKNSKVLVKIVNVDFGQDGGYEFKFCLNNSVVKMVNMDKIYSSITSKGYYIFEYENLTDNVIESELEFRNYFGGYYITEITICEANSSARQSTQSILLPQPLNKIGDIKDKFYWDDDKGHYCIEQNIYKHEVTEVDSWNLALFSDVRPNKYMYHVQSSIEDYNKLKTGVNTEIYIASNKFTNVPPYYNGKYAQDIDGVEFISKSLIWTNRYGLMWAINSSKLEGSNTNYAKKYLKSKLPFDMYFVLETPNIIDLPHLNRKYSLDTYMPTTYLQCVDTFIQPSKLLLESDIVRYKPSALETNTDYTVQFECKEKSDKKVKLNLGGSEKEVEAVVGLNHVSITTSSELSKDKLFLSGVGNKVDNVMVIKGEMNQYPSYFDGVANTGVLQGDKYKIDISVSNGNDFDFNSYSGGSTVDKVGNSFVFNNGSMRDHLLYIDGFGVVKPNETIYVNIKVETKNITGGGRFRVGLGDKSAGWYAFYNLFKEVDTSNPNSMYELKGILKNNSTKDLYLYLCGSSNGNVGGNVIFSDIYISRTKQADTYVDYSNFKLLINANQPLMKAGDTADRLYWNKSNRRYEIDRNGDIEIPIVEGDVIDLPRLYQREDTTLTVETGNIKPSSVKIEYNDLN